MQTFPLVSALVLSLTLAAPIAAAETLSTDESASRLIPPTETSTLRNQLGFAFPEAPEVPQGPPDEALVADIDGLFFTLRDDSEVDVEALKRIAESGDPRAAWTLVDLWRFLPQGLAADVSQAGFSLLTEARLQEDPIAFRSPLQSAVDHLIAWDLPALPQYERWKGML